MVKIYNFVFNLLAPILNSLAIFSKDVMFLKFFTLSEKFLIHRFFIVQNILSNTLF